MDYLIRKQGWQTRSWAVCLTLILCSCRSTVQNTPRTPIKETADQVLSSSIPATHTPSPPPTRTVTITPSPEALKEEQADLFAVLEPSLTTADCLAAGVPEIACTGVSTNEEWVPVIREFGGIPMALVPAGCYTMGSTAEQIEQYLTMMDLPDLYKDERPAHPQCFQEPFWIDVYEVTNGFYGSYGFWRDNDQPRESVTWFEANTYCTTRGGRLPSEAEWEYAARGPDNLIYPWGNPFDGSRLNFCDANCQDPGSDPSIDDGYAFTAPVGSYPAGVSWVGAFDMAGNVWEWVSTSLQPYPYYPDDGREVNPEQLDSTSTMAVRGGGRLDPDYVVRTTNRNERMAHYFDPRFGLRCARAFDSEYDGETAAQARPEMVMEPPGDPELGDTWIRPFDGAVMIYVPGGTFQMGASQDPSSGGDFNKNPEHPVRVDGFWIDKHLVDNKQFTEFLYFQGNLIDNGVTWYDDESEYSLFVNWGDFLKPYLGFEDYPVMDISWYGAQAYCEWVGGRLLTEAEWEYAARGPENRIYPWGNEFDCTRGNFSEGKDDEEPGYSFGESGCDEFELTSPVDAHPQGASWVGVLDLAGNVWDWVADWGATPYPAGLQVNPTGPESGTNKIARGGAWDNYGWEVRTTLRGEFPPTERSPAIGFRCAYPAAP